MVESIPSMFHLRRVQFQGYVKEVKGRPVAPEIINDALEPNTNLTVRDRSTMILLDKQTKIGRNPELVDVVLHSVVHSNMISRDHSEIIGETDAKGQFVRYYISDRSLNGTYVNDTRVKENVLLREGDLIKFGHVNGAAIKPGEHAPQHSAEFIFRFERALSNFAYFGYSQKGIRLPQHNGNNNGNSGSSEQQQRRAYMQINSDRVLPTEVYASTSSLTVSGTAAGLPKPLPSSGAPVNNSNGPLPNHSASSLASSTTSSSHLPATAVNSSSGAAPSTSAASTTTPPTNQLAHLAAVAAATTLANSAAAAAAANNQNHNNIGAIQHNSTGASSAGINAATAQSALNALNQLGLSSATDEQVAAVNAHLRQLMASHDAMSAMERLAAQQQWNNSLLKLSSLQQQNPLVYGHAFPAAAAAAAALFTGCIDLNSAANNPTNAAAQYAAAASLWPNIRALQPSAAQAVDWTQQQQKAAALAQQLQLRLPGSMPALYQQQQQQQQQTNAVRTPVTAPSAPPSLFGTPSAFSLPGAASVASTASLPSSSAGLLIAAQQQQNSCSSTASASAAYSSCTSSITTSVGAIGNPLRAPPGESPISCLSRGASSASLSIQPNDQQHQHQSAAALAARIAAAQQLAKEFEAEQQAKGNSVPGWPMGISCSSVAGPSIPATKVSPVIGSAVSSSATTPLQRIPGIASALAAAVAAAQQQHQQQQNGALQHQQHTPWPSGTPPGIPPSVPSVLGTPPIQQPLAQRLLASSSAVAAMANHNSSTLSSGGSSKSSSGVSSAPSTGTTLLQSPISEGTISGQLLNNISNCDAGKEFRDSLSSSLSSTNNSASSAFSTPQLANNTNLNTLTAAMFAAEKEKMNAQQRQRLATSISEEAKKGIAAKERETQQRKTLKRGKSERDLQQQSNNVSDRKAVLNGSSSSISADLDQLQLEKKADKGGEEGGEVAKKERRMTADGARKMEETIECDSSVPSPPGKEHQQKDGNKGEEKLEPGLESRTSSVTSDTKKQQEKAESIEPSARRKRHSSSKSSAPVEDDDESDRDSKKGDDKKGKNSKLRPIKQPRKSNEVARLLNDLTAGNCSWQYMAERSQKLAAQAAKVKSREKNYDGAKKSSSGGKEGSLQQQQQAVKSVPTVAETRKKPLRLEDRKRAEIERKRAHKMMRQISDESSDEEGGAGGKNNRIGTAESGAQQIQRHNGGNKVLKQLGSSMSTNSDEGEDNVNDKSANSDSDSEDGGADSKTRQQRHRTAREKNSSPAKSTPTPSPLVNGGGTTAIGAKRKLLSSAPGTKKAALNNATANVSKLTNGGPKNLEEKPPKKRGPKARTAGEDKTRSTRTAKTAATSSSTITLASALSKKRPLGRKMGSEAGRVRPAAHANSSNNSSSSSGDDSSGDEALFQNGGAGRATVNGGGLTTAKGGETATKKGRKPKRGRSGGGDATESDLAATTVAEDWTGGRGDPELCAHKLCKRPIHMSINWVQCDDCDQWFHSTCVFGDNRMPDEDDFHCGCKNAGKAEPATTRAAAKNATNNSNGKGSLFNSSSSAVSF